MKRSRFRLFCCLALIFAESICAQVVPFDSTANFTSDAFYAKAFALGDFDNDGDLDLACGGWTPSVYKNENGVFAEMASWQAKELSQGPGPRWVDFDGDGDLDLLCGGTTYYYYSVAIYTNLGGQLESEAGWLKDSLLSVAEWGDVDGDGDLDLAAVNTDYHIVVFLNNNGILASVPDWVSSDTARTASLAWGDADGDGDLDLACGNYGRNQIYFNFSGTLNTVAGWRSDESYQTLSIAWGDIDGNGYLDLASGNYYTGSEGYPAPNTVHFNYYGVLLTAAGWVSEPAITQSIRLGDIDNDGDLDLASADWNFPGDFPPGATRVYINDGNTFPKYANWITAEDGGSMRLEWGDVNNDGNLDLICGVSRLRIYYNHNQVLESSAKYFPSRDHTRDMAWADFDLDGDLDLACASLNNEDRVFANDNGMLDFIPVWYSSEKNMTLCLSWGDVDNDGDLDLVCGSGSTGSDDFRPNRIYINQNGILDNTPGSFLTDTLPTYDMAWGDVDGDGYNDLVCAGSPAGVADSGASLMLYKNNGGILETTASWMAEKIDHFWDLNYSVDWADVDGDGDLDLISTAKLYINHNGSLERNPSWRFPVLQDFIFSSVWGDVDGDGDPDLACASRHIYVFINRHGVLEETASWVSKDDIGSPRDIAWADVDGDGDLDLACSKGLWVGDEQQNAVYFNIAGTLEPRASWLSDDAAISPALAWGDVDGDGDLDLAVANDGNNALHFNLRAGPRPINPYLPDNPPWIRSAEMLYLDSSTNQVEIGFTLVDSEANPAVVAAEYSILGGGLWQPATLIGSPLILETSPDGIQHTLQWDAEADGVDGYNVALKIKVWPGPDYTGLFQWPAQTYSLPVGRINGRPLISILYPRAAVVIADSAVIFGRIWDATNLRDVDILLGRLPDTSTWQSVFTTDRSMGRLDHIATIDLTGWEAGEYIARIIATDNKSFVRTLDETFELISKSSVAPRVISSFPKIGATNIPTNAPVVVKFDSDMNQSILNSETFNLFSESGERYKDATYDFASRTLTLNPLTNYSTLQFHYAVVNSAFQNQSGNALGAEVALGFTTSLKEPGFQVDELHPLRGEVGVSIATEISIKLRGLSGDPNVLLFSLAGDTVTVDSSVYDDLSRTWTYYPSALLPKTYYVMRISDKPSFDGDSDYMSYFVTEDTQLPLAVDYAPDDKSWLVGLDSPVLVEFNKPMNTFSIDESSFSVTGPTGAVPGVIEFGGEDGTIATFYANQPLEPGSDYTVVLTDHIQDNIGNPITPLSWTFTTGMFGTASYDGSVVSSPGIDLSFPLGAISPDIEVGLGQIPSEKMPVEGGFDFSGVAYEVRPAMALQRQAILTITLPDSLFTTGNERYALYYRDTAVGSWQYIGGTQSGPILKCSIDKLGTYGVFVAGETELAGTDLGASLALLPRVISPRTGGVNSRLNISFRVAEATEVIARIYDTSGRLVKTLSAGSIAQVGENLLSWDGRTDDGEYATDGLHVVVIEAAGQKAQKTFVILNR